MDWRRVHAGTGPCCGRRGGSVIRSTLVRDGRHHAISQGPIDHAHGARVFRQRQKGHQQNPPVRSETNSIKLRQNATIAQNHMIMLL